MKIVFEKKVHKRWKDELNQYGMIYLYAMSGFGKTVQAEEFASREFKEWTRIECTENFFKDLDTYLKNSKNTRIKQLLIIDDLQWLKDKSQQEKFLEKLFWILKNRKNIYFMILSRARIPEYLTVLKLTKQTVVENYESLLFTKEMMVDLIEDSGLIKKRKDLFPNENTIQNYAFEKCEKESRGYAIAFNAYVERLKEPQIDFETAYRLALEDVYTYLDLHIFKEWDLKYQEIIVRLSVCDSFNMEIAKIIIGKNAEDSIEELYKIGSFFSEKEDQMITINPIFLGFLRTKLRKFPEEQRKRLYEKVGNYYEQKRDIVKALACYEEAGLFTQMLDLIYYLSENADGCSFAKTCYKYVKNMPEEYEEKYPKLLAAKAMVYSYHMEVEKSEYYLEKLKEKANDEKKDKYGNEIISIYIRTIIALPHGTAEKTMHNLKFYPRYLKKNGIKFRDIMPTGNMPSMINGGLDLTSWGKEYKVLYPIMKLGSEAIFGKEAVGIADVSVGEHLYEQNKFTESIAYLTRGLSEANLKDNIRVQYASTAIMAKVFQGDKQWETGYEIMQNILRYIKEKSFYELVPNVQASIIEAELLKGNNEKCKKWLETKPADEHSDFYITERYRLFVKAKVYVTLNRNMEALYILELLKKYAKLYKRPYFLIEIEILRAIIFERNGDNWKETIISAIEQSREYNYVRILADWGASLLPLWKQLMDDDSFKERLKGKYETTVYRELKKMTTYYPQYLKTSKTFGKLTKKEMTVLQLMDEGFNNRQIAENLNISIPTVKFHISNILKKLKVDNRTSAVSIARQEGII